MARRDAGALIQKMSADDEVRFTRQETKYTLFEEQRQNGCSSWEKAIDDDKKEESVT